MAQIEKLVESARSYLEPGEAILASVMGTYEVRGAIKNGIFLATDRRLVFYSKKLTGYDMEVFLYSSIGSVETGKDFMGHRIAFLVSGNKVTMKWINAGNVPEFIQAVNQGVNGENILQGAAVQEDSNMSIVNAAVPSKGIPSRDTVVLKQAKKPIWKRWWVWAAAILILIAAFSGDEQTSTPVGQSNGTQNIGEKVPTEGKSIPGSLEITPEEFRQRFNDASTRLDAGFNINDFEVKTGEVQDVYQDFLTSNIGLLVAVNKRDGSVRDVTLIAQGDGTLKSGADIIIAMGTLVTAFHPEFTPDERGKVLRDLGLFEEGSDILNLQRDTTRGKYKYWINSSPTIGIMFGVNDKNDKG